MAWLGIATLVFLGWLFADYAAKDKGYVFTLQMLSHTSMLIAILAYWELTAVPEYELIARIAHVGSDINTIFTLLMNVMLAMLWTSHPLFVCVLIHYKNRKSSPLRKNQ